MLIHILMATYNGEKYLPEQLASIVAQTENDWKLHIRDDNSEDGTWELLEDFAARFPGQVELTKNQRRLGAKGNFARLLREVQEPGDYVFCDQDDIWEPRKLSTLQRKLRESERQRRFPRRYRKKTERLSSEGDRALPVLVYSDAIVIDGKGRTIEKSFVGQTGIKLPETRVMESLFLCNFVQGATSMWNESLQHLLGKYPMPREALMHDWWTALVAAGHGRIVFVPECLIRYRQHEDNVVGGFHRREWRRRMGRNLGRGKMHRLAKSNHRMQERRRRQAEAYLRLYGDRRAQRYLEIVGKRLKPYRAYLGIREGYIFISRLYSLKYYLL